MSDQPPHSLDDSARMQLAQVRETLHASLAQFQGDPQLRRAFIHSIGAIDDRLGRPREWPSRQERRQGR